MQRIECKYSERLVVPAAALSSNINEEYQTMDGVICTLRYIMGCDNQGGRFEDDLDETCKRLYDCRFGAIRSIWFGRLGYVEDFWYLVEMIKK